ncbi:Hint domain-containing protein [Jannaschia formosa]|uniref:Hint domain-containing protein n=1 Tax=Jannaschia formosa TaxID=2259592 RepID=UPI0014309100|nr:Hint domain-containing protein [Jannaschia formosa]
MFHQVRVDGAVPSTRCPFPAGQMLRWTGTALRLDGPQAHLLTRLEEIDADWRDRVPHAAARLARTRGEAPRSRPGPAAPEASLLLAHGDDRYHGQIVHASDGEPFLLFEDGLPPADRDLMILRASAPVPRLAATGTVCFTPGTVILTEDGPRPVEALHPGDRVLTRDDGAQEIRWMGLRCLSRATLAARPDLRPIRLRRGALGPGEPRPDLILSPDHRVMLTGPKARALWGEAEVLVRAGDLVDDARVLRDHGAREVTYIHLLFARHQVIWANRVEVESFHPGDADLSRLNPSEREELLEIAPGADTDPSAYGPHARRCLTAAELALLRHDGAPAYLS